MFIYLFLLFFLCFVGWDLLEAEVAINKVSELSGEIVPKQALWLFSCPPEDEELLLRTMGVESSIIQS